MSTPGAGSFGYSMADLHVLERQRQRSQASGITLSEADLNEYRQLCVCLCDLFSDSGLLSVQTRIR